MSEEQKPKIEDVEFKPASPEVLAAIEKELAAVRARSFSGRHPELGKMIKCQVCKLRHRAPLDKDNKPVTKCVQQFAVKHYEQTFNPETKEWSEEVALLAQTDQRTRNGVLGAAQFKGRRLKAHPSKIKLLFIEKVREAFEMRGYSLDDPKEVLEANLHKARQLAALWIRIERKLDTRERNHMRRISRRINCGLATPGSR